MDGGHHSHPAKVRANPPLVDPFNEVAVGLGAGEGVGKDEPGEAPECVGGSPAAANTRRGKHPRSCRARLPLERWAIRPIKYNRYRLHALIILRWGRLI